MIFDSNQCSPRFLKILAERGDGFQKQLLDVVNAAFQVPSLVQFIIIEPLGPTEATIFITGLPREQGNPHNTNMDVKFNEHGRPSTINGKSFEYDPLLLEEHKVNTMLNATFNIAAEICRKPIPHAEQITFERNSTSNNVGVFFSNRNGGESQGTAIPTVV